MAGVASIRASAFLTRSIRQESRQILHHGTRAALAVCVLIAIAMQQIGSSLFGASGLRLYSMIAVVCYWFLTLAGTLYFAMAIAEEKDEDTLPLLRMTGVTNFALLTGKSLPRLMLVILLLLVILPFTVLSVALGGITFQQILASQLSLICYAFLLSQAGLLAGTVSSTGQRAFSVALILWLLLELGYTLIYAASSGLAEYGFRDMAFMLNEVSDWLRNHSLLMNLNAGLMLDDNDSIWRPHAMYHICCGALCFLLSWLCFDRCTRTAFGQSVSAESGSRASAMVTALGKRNSRRAWDNALFWKSWQFISGGSLWFMIRLIMIPVLAIGIPAAACIITREQPDWWEMIGVSLTMTGIILFAVDMSRQMGRVLNDEVFRQTAVSLCMLPQKSSRSILSLVLGVIPSALPALLYFLVGMAMQIAADPSSGNDWDDVTEWFMEPWMLHFLTWVVLTVHCGLLLSTVLRYGGMLLSAVILWIAAPMFFSMFFWVFAMAIGASPMRSEEAFRFLLPCALIVTEILACWLIQKLIVRRVEAAAAR
jgi:ABC-type transport system involved in multi-copper enzyme maturation permease subunit